MKHLVYIALSLVFGACNPVDRSGEQPLPPTVQTLDAEDMVDSVRLNGVVLTSPNSDITDCGFYYGNDTLRLTAKAVVSTASFSAITDSLGVGTYFYVAYAKNGVGTGYGDTLRFTIKAKP